ncbi:NADPH-dependent 7-cyano-7-deazaguanine reductase QueF [Aquirhabdus sp.]|uniref:NADPH-dependent 7-cyano-7-deazaguanine reductase QueF n=1 Tax=Aquirhabdus sp. TaxID=2824160 RepID=UPI00396CC70E
MSVNDSALGEETVYPDHYNPALLFPIARAEGRALLGATYPETVNQGVDIWHIFELSWLDQSGKPIVAVGRMALPANSLYLIESKSLKLYFNSLNFETFADPDAFLAVVIKDLSAAAHAPVQLELLGVDELATHLPQGIYLDELATTPSPAPTEPDASLLKLDDRASEIVEETLYSNLLRSNCPVTGQPDWGTVFIRYRGAKLCQSSLLTYIISYRKHSGFHEQCVEQIFADIWQHLKPEALAVHAQYTRRGGLDINPCRTSDLHWLPQVTRLARQ